MANARVWVRRAGYIALLLTMAVLAPAMRSLIPSAGNLIANVIYGTAFMVIGLLVLRRTRPSGRWDYRPFGALGVFFGAIGLAFVVAEIVSGS